MKTKERKGLKYILFSLLIIATLCLLFVVYPQYIRRAALPSALVNKTWVVVKYSQPDREYRRLLHYTDPVLKTHSTSYEDMLEEKSHKRVVREVGLWVDSIDRLKRFDGSDSIITKYYITYGHLPGSLLDKYRDRDKTIIHSTTDIFTMVDTKQGVYKWLQRESVKEYLIMDYEKAQHLPFISDDLLPQLQNKKFYLAKEWKGDFYINLSEGQFETITTKGGTEFIVDSISMGRMDKVEETDYGWNMMFPSASGINLLSHDGYRYYPDVDTLKVKTTKISSIFDIEQKIKQTNSDGEPETITTKMKVVDKMIIDSLIRKDPVEALEKGYGGIHILPQFYYSPTNTTSYQLRASDSLHFDFLVKDIDELLKYKYPEWKKMDTTKIDIKKGYNTYDKVAIITHDSIASAFFFNKIRGNIYKLLHQVSFIYNTDNAKLTKMERTHGSFSFTIAGATGHTNYLYSLENDQWELSRVQEVNNQGAIINNYQSREEERQPYSFHEFWIEYPFSGFRGAK